MDKGDVDCVHIYMCVLIRVWLFVTPWTAACQDLLSMEFPRQEYWSGLPFPPPGKLPYPETEPASPLSPELQVDSLPLHHQGNPKHLVLWLVFDTNKINTIDWVNTVAALPYCFLTSFPPIPQLYWDIINTWHGVSSVRLFGTHIAIWLPL